MFIYYITSKLLINVSCIVFTSVIESYARKCYYIHPRYYRIYVYAHILINWTHSLTSRKELHTMRQGNLKCHIFGGINKPSNSLFALWFFFWRRHFPRFLSVSSTVFLLLNVHTTLFFQYYIFFKLFFAFFIPSHILIWRHYYFYSFRF